MAELWKDVKDYEGLYQVSNLGRVKSLDHYTPQKNRWGEIVVRHRGRILRMKKDKRGYSFVTLCKDSVNKMFSVHRLVAEAFIPNTENKPSIDHIIPVSIGGTNEATNLRWCTPVENMNNEFTYETINKAKEKAIIGYDIEGNEVCRFNSIKEAQENGYNGHIGEVANGRRIKSNNLYWKWEI